MGKKARAAGSFLGGIANNPGIIILGALAIGLLFFQKDIRNAFGSLGESISGGLGDINIQLPSISLPEIKLPEIKFPEFKFPEFKFPTLPDLLTPGAITPPEQDPAAMPELSIGLAGGIQERRRALEQALALAAIPERDIQDDIEGLTPTQRFSFIERGVIPSGFEVVGGQLQRIMEILSPIIPSELAPIQSFLIGQPIQQFQGGGVSFFGGSIFETPLENLSLSQIIDKFNVTASQAASLRAEAIGFTPEEETFLQGSGDIFGFTGFNPPAISDPQFEGLTPQEIVLRLLGGNIQNF